MNLREPLWVDMSRLDSDRRVFVAYRSGCLDASMPSSQTRPPIGEEGEEVGDADVAVVVKVGGAATPNSREG